jgi:hypothetical protein
MTVPDALRKFELVLDTTTSSAVHHDETNALQTKFCSVLAFVEVSSS